MRKGRFGRAEGARRKKWGQNRNIRAYFQIFFVCGELNLLRYQIHEPTPYTTILREPKNAAERVILQYKMYIYEMEIRSIFRWKTHLQKVCVI